MHCQRFYQRGVVLATALSLLLSPSLSAQRPGLPVQGTPSAVTVHDVVRDPQGRVVGQIVSPQGHPVVGAEVQAWQAGKVVAQATSDQEGRFVLAELRGGVYQIITASGGSVYRVWPSSAAPPVARPQLLLVQGAVVRGQLHGSATQNGVGTGLFGGAFTHALSNPWVVSGLLAAGIAIPIAVSNNDDDKNGS